MAAPLSVRAAAVLLKRQNLLRLPAEELVNKTKAKFVHGRWRSAELNGRAINELRKLSIKEGVEFPIPRKPIKTEMPRMKGKKHVAAKARRVEEVSKNMESMDKLVEDHRKTVREQRQKQRLAKKHYLFPLP